MTTPSIFYTKPTSTSLFNRDEDDDELDESDRRGISNNIQPIFDQPDPYRTTASSRERDGDYRYATAGTVGSGDLYKDPSTGVISGTPPLASIQPIAPTISPGSYVADAARLLGGAVGNNPFISQAARTGLSEGGVPALNQISPAFFRYTTPSISQALLGLFESIGRPREDSLFTVNQFRPPSIR